MLSAFNHSQSSPTRSSSSAASPSRYPVNAAARGGTFFQRMYSAPSPSKSALSTTVPSFVAIASISAVLRVRITNAECQYFIGRSFDVESYTRQIDREGSEMDFNSVAFDRSLGQSVVVVRIINSQKDIRLSSFTDHLKREQIVNFHNQLVVPRSTKYLPNWISAFSSSSFSGNYDVYELNITSAIRPITVYPIDASITMNPLSLVRNACTVETLTEMYERHKSSSSSSSSSSTAQQKDMYVSFIARVVGVKTPLENPPTFARSGTKYDLCGWSGGLVSLAVFNNNNANDQNSSPISPLPVAAEILLINIPVQCYNHQLNFRMGGTTYSETFIAVNQGLMTVQNNNQLLSILNEWRLTSTLKGLVIPTVAKQYSDVFNVFHSVESILSRPNSCARALLKFKTIVRNGDSDVGIFRRTCSKCFNRHPVSSPEPDGYFPICTSTFPNGPNGAASVVCDNRDSDETALTEFWFCAVFTNASLTRRDSTASTDDAPHGNDYVLRLNEAAGILLFGFTAEEFAQHFRTLAVETAEEDFNWLMNNPMHQIIDCMVTNEYSSQTEYSTSSSSNYSASRSVAMLQAITAAHISRPFNSIAEYIAAAKAGDTDEELSSQSNDRSAWNQLNIQILSEQKFDDDIIPETSNADYKENEEDNGSKDDSSLDVDPDITLSPSRDEEGDNVTEENHHDQLDIDTKTNDNMHTVEPPSFQHMNKKIKRSLQFDSDNDFDDQPNTKQPKRAIMGTKKSMKKSGKSKQDFKDIDSSMMKSGSKKKKQHHSNKSKKGGGC